jgi:tetratricopeptide (TPR) repeat protein
MEFDPSWHETRHNLGLLYMAKGESEKAIAQFEEAAAHDPFKDATLLNLGYLYDRAGRREDAIRNYVALVKRKPDNGAGWYNLASIALEEGQLENARRAARQVLASSPDDAGAKRLFAEIERASRTVRPATAERQQATLRRCERAKQAVDEGRNDEAIALLDVAAWLDERAALPHHYLANVHYMAGRLALATKEEREAVRRAPENELYRRNLEALEKAMSEKR